MASSVANIPSADANIVDVESDYGSDFSPEQEQIVVQLLSLSSIATEDNPIINEVENDLPERKLCLPRILDIAEGFSLSQVTRSTEAITHFNGSNGSRAEAADSRNRVAHEASAEESPKVEGGKSPDLRSPLERFRSKPKKGLSVTDLISPAWCELQYWYTLTKHGRKRRTPAMKRGTAVHQKLEDQVHIRVPVETTTREDDWGLRIWNVIQGLRNLRETGITRELEVWGTVDGLVVNGVIDELSYTCPDSNLEALHSTTVENEAPPGQTTISDFFQSVGGTTIKDAVAKQCFETKERKKIYLCDVKTRAARRLPNETAFRPTRMQLMLYHQLISNLVIGAVNFQVFADRHDLDAEKIFSDAFIASVGSLNNEWISSQDSELPNLSQDSVDQLLSHNTLSLLWTFMLSEFQTTFPRGVDSLGQVLKTEYRSSETAEIMGVKTILMDKEELKKYVDSELAWWRGQRTVTGVFEAEAFKCGMCEFAEICDWRIGKEEEVKDKVRRGRKKITTT